jgi:hypothetical protein
METNVRSHATTALTYETGQNLLGLVVGAMSGYVYRQQTLLLSFVAKVVTLLMLSCPLGGCYVGNFGPPFDTSDLCTGLPLTRYYWTGVGEQAKAQWSACFGSPDARRSVPEIVAATLLFCPLVPFTPVLTTYFVVGLMPVSLTIDLLSKLSPVCHGDIKPHQECDDDQRPE